ncbi:DNA methyltransferase [Anatilimnocola floriformis]|uniref:DNA methyltransferase n=1 Tax=Anatilimnocola floriformis TaxID=2948575 RepID=UPI0020C27960|nr:DNA methyltransferase [Anatilimnocola floriformis]
MNSVVLGDCVAGMRALAAGSVDLVFADPPFNIGYDYDVYHDRQEHEAYLAWSKQWIGAVHRALKPDGSFWLAIGDEYAAELKIISQEIGFHTRSWVIWYYTFGVNCKQKFTRSHAHLFYFVKDRAKFTFRADELENRIPSARQLVYNDSRGNPNGRLPDDTWILRPQDSAGFTAGEDTWYIPRVAGTFKERAGFHGCQMPEQLLGRIIRVCSNSGELVVDPFSGSATTLAVAKKLGRRYLGFDLSPEYVERGESRLAGIRVGDRLDGDAEPLMSAPSTVSKSQRSSPKKKKNGVPAVFAEAEANAETRSLAIAERGLIEAFAAACDGYSADRVVADPELNAAFAARCRAIALPGSERDWNHYLFNLRKAGKLAEIKTAKRSELSWEDFDRVSFASEIALKQMMDAGAESLDEILCDPQLAAQFDAIAVRFAPDAQTVNYRLAALKLRKEAKNARTRAQLLKIGRLSKAMALNEVRKISLPDAGGIFVVQTDRESLYVGEALNLQGRVQASFQKNSMSVWETLLDSKKKQTLSFSYCQTGGDKRDLLGYQSKFIEKLKPRYNFELFRT